MTVRSGEIFWQDLLDDSLMRINQSGQFEVIDADRDVEYWFDQKVPRLKLTIHLRKRVATSALAPQPQTIQRASWVQVP